MRLTKLSSETFKWSALGTNNPSYTAVRSDRDNEYKISVLSRGGKKQYDNMTEVKWFRTRC